GAAQENICVSTGNGTADSFDIFGTVVGSLKSLLKWSLVCEEVEKKEQSRMEKIVGPLGHDPTAPDDLNTVTDTLMFDSATIIAALIVTFFVFYFIDFFMQMFTGVSTMLSADASPSVASLQPVIPTRARKRRKSGSSMSKEITPSDATQPTNTPLGTPSPMKDLLTKSIRPNFSQEPVLPPTNPPSSQNKNVDQSSVKFDSTPKPSPDRRLAGRSPAAMLPAPEEDSDIAYRNNKSCERRSHPQLLPMMKSISPVETLKLAEEKATQTYAETTPNEHLDQMSYKDYDYGGSLDEKHQLYFGGNVYDEIHELPYADDLPGDEFNEYRYEEAQAYLEYMNQFEDIRSEFSIDDDAELDEWKKPGHSNPASPGNSSEKHSSNINPPSPANSSEKHSSNINPPSPGNSSEKHSSTISSPSPDNSSEKNSSDISDSLFFNAERIFNQLQKQRQQKMCKTELLLQSGRQNVETHLFSPENCDEVQPQINGQEPARRKDRTNANVSPSSEDSATQHSSGDDEEVEKPRATEPLNHRKYSRYAEPFLTGLDNSPTLKDGFAEKRKNGRTAKSISTFSIRHSMEIRRYHHVLFTYPDPTPYKVLLTGSFFGWKMSLPMQREKDAFRLSMTLPAGEHQYRFEVHRHQERNDANSPFIFHD
ncbi:hypothetical protein V3C99_008339, partial [Haemonchus contortus]